MSQFDFGNLSSPLTGAEFIDDNLEPFRDAQNTNHSGTSTPSYVVPGMIWIDTTTNPWVLYLNDGTDDIEIGEIDTVANTFTPARSITRWGGTAGGTANALTLTPDPALEAAPGAGVAYEMLVPAANTSAAPTLDVSGQGALEIRHYQGAGKVAIPPYGLQPGVITVIFDGTHWVVLNERFCNKGADIASASTLNLNNATGDYVAVTGTTTITAITIGVGIERTVRADGAFIITHGSSLICPGAANITTIAGDVFVVRGEESGVARIISYQRGNGVPVAVDTDGTLAANSDTKVPSQKAVKTLFASAATDVVIYDGTLPGGAQFNSITWTAALYRAIHVEIRDLAHSGSSAVAQTGVFEWLNSGSATGETLSLTGSGTMIHNNGTGHTTMLEAGILDGGKPAAFYASTDVNLTAVFATASYSNITGFRIGCSTSARQISSNTKVRVIGKV